MSHDEEMDAAMARIGVLRYRLEQAEAEVTDLNAKADQSEADLEKSDGVVWTLSVENARLKAEVDRLAQCEGYHYTAIAISMLKEQLQQKNIDYVEARKANKAKVEMIKSLKAEVERLTKENETINKDRTLLWASHKIALQDIQGLHYALQTAKEGKQS